MSSAATTAVVADHESYPPPLVLAKERLLSLDVFRGMTLIFMTIVNLPGEPRYTYAPLTHVRWNG